ncbi:MAG: GNAT family N-acetyltransferase [Nitrospirota bacterium]
MADKITFRPLTVSDVHFLAEYAAICEGIIDITEIEKVEARLKKRVENPNYIGVTTLINNKRVGFIDGIIVKETLELNEIYVTKQYRSQGIGIKLVEEILLIAKSRGAKQAIYYTEPDNIVMQKLGEKAGFQLKSLLYEKKL